MSVQKTNVSKINPDRLSENHKQMFNLVTYVINKVYEIKYENNALCLMCDRIGFVSSCKILKKISKLKA